MEIMKKYVRRYCSWIHLDAMVELVAKLRDALKHCRTTETLDILKPMLQAAILDESIIRMGIRFRRQIANDLTSPPIIQIPGDLEQICQRVCHLELPCFVSASTGGAIYPTSLTQATKGVGLLKDKFPYLKSCRLSLEVDVSGGSEVVVSTGLWLDCTCLSGVNWHTPPISTTLRAVILELLDAFKSCGAAENRTFILNMQPLHLKNRPGYWEVESHELKLDAFESGGEIINAAIRTLKYLH